MKKITLLLLVAIVFIVNCCYSQTHLGETPDQIKISLSKTEYVFRDNEYWRAENDTVLKYVKENIVDGFKNDTIEYFVFRNNICYSFTLQYHDVDNMSDFQKSTEYLSKVQTSLNNFNAFLNNENHIVTSIDRFQLEICLTFQTFESYSSKWGLR